MPNQLLPVSAAPLGQAPLAGINIPNAGISVPRPLDVSAFFQAQNAIQNNIGILQQKEINDLRKQQLELQNQQLLFDQASMILNRLDQGFDNFYTQTANNRRTKSARPESTFTNLDRSRPAHAALIEKYQNKFDEKMDEASKIGIGYLSSGAKDSASMVETALNIDKLMNETRGEMLSDRDFINYSGAEARYDQLIEEIANAKANNKNLVVDGPALQNFLNRYDEFTSVNPNLKFSEADWDASTYLRDISSIDDLLNDAKTLSQFQESFEEVKTDSGKVLEGTRSTRLPIDDAVQILVEKYEDDSGINYLYNTAGTIVLDATTGEYVPIAKEDWIKRQISPLWGGKDSYISETNKVLFEPEKEEEQSVTLRGSRLTGAAKNEFDTGLDIVERANIDPERFDMGQLRQIGAADRNDVSIDPNTGVVNINVRDSAGEATGEVKTFVPREIPEPIQAGPVQEGDDLGSRNNNPGNLRPTQAQTDAGVKTDENGFIVFDSLEDGQKAHLSDLKAKINGNSTGMKSSPYMVDKYGKDNLGNYQEFATIEDLINVRTPRESFGGDNSDEVVDNFLSHLENKGFDRNTKLSEIGEEIDNLNNAIIEFESPDSFARLYGDRAGKTEQNVAPVNPRQIEFSPREVSANTLDFILGDSFGYDAINDFINNPLPGFENVSNEVKAKLDKQQKLESEIERLQVEADEDFNPNESNRQKAENKLESKLQELQDMIPDISLDGIRGKLMDTYIKSDEGKEVFNDYVKSFILGNMSIGEQITLDFSDEEKERLASGRKSGLPIPETTSSGYRIKALRDNNYALTRLDYKTGKPGKVKIMNDNELVSFLSENRNRLEIANSPDFENTIAILSTDRIAQRQRDLIQAQENENKRTQNVNNRGVDFSQYKR